MKKKKDEGEGNEAEREEKEKKIWRKLRRRLVEMAVKQ
jgi:hypothetical protein